MKLYYFPESPNSSKVHAVAVHLNLSLELHFVDITQGASHTPEFLELNPTGRTPVLQDGDFVLWEATAIMQYLASQVPNTLYPGDRQIRADIARWQSWQLAHWYPACQTLTYENCLKGLLQRGAPDPQVVQTATARFHQEAIILDRHLAKQEYLVGTGLTLADFSVTGDLVYAVPGQFPLEEYPHIWAWYARIAALPDWQQTAPKL
jgi:glutathione S-transferase